MLKKTTKNFQITRLKGSKKVILILLQGYYMQGFLLMSGEVLTFRFSVRGRSSCRILCEDVISSCQIFGRKEPKMGIKGTVLENFSDILNIFFRSDTNLNFGTWVL